MTMRLCRILGRARARLDLSADAEVAWRRAWRSYAEEHRYRRIGDPTYPLPREIVMLLAMGSMLTIPLLQRRLRQA